ncbi:hypothetical protein EYF80_054616 [Liparis tanakae]|uniref:Uncharacterized protein n=1 Tax=Liparis tanakae TaxID=230148 RepID=A0A4Z2F372_9TELE|nr:hypothetical protein EYF80_054616 [Liparis tanakae]
MPRWVSGLCGTAPSYMPSRPAPTMHLADASVSVVHQLPPEVTRLCLRQFAACYLPATTIFSSLPFRARSLLCGRVVSAIKPEALHIVLEMEPDQ